ncbi:hypothetical protein AB1Y20_021687 [Prymnesium parvum]|uniref:Cyclic nucleotide-binding domain-containing protein n=1 Tax=Prymnesium parvum TaxID=97485 RepID=A0AB34JLC4_PRYPA
MDTESLASHAPSDWRRAGTLTSNALLMQEEAKEDTIDLEGVAPRAPIPPTVSRKGRAPRAATSEGLASDSRALLALLMSDAPPAPSGFAAKVTGSQVLSVYPHSDYTRLHQDRSIKEDEQRAIRVAVHQGEANAVKCLHSILAQTSTRLKTATFKLQQEIESDESSSMASGRRTVKSVRTSCSRGSYNLTSLRRRGGFMRKDSDGDDVAQLRDVDEMLDALVEEAEDRPDTAAGMTEVDRADSRGSGSESEDEAAGVHIGARMPVVPGIAPLGEPAAAMTVVRRRLLSTDSSSKPFALATKGETIELMRRVRFFREAELQEELYPVVAECFETQCWEGLRTVEHEGNWGNSFFILASGIVEAYERLPMRGAAGPSATVRRGSPEANENSSVSEQSLSTAILRKDGALPPTLFYAGAYWGEGALVGEFPLTCNVRTLERCVLLVLRRSKVSRVLATLPVTARQAWGLEAQRTRATHEVLTRLWRRRKLRYIPMFKRVSHSLINALELAAGYRLVPANTALLQQGRPADTAFIVLLGETAFFEHPPMQEDGEWPPPRLLRRVSSHSDIPIIGVEALMGEVSLPYSVVTRTDCQLFPLVRRDLAPSLLEGICSRLRDVLAAPVGLMARLNGGAVSGGKANADIATKFRISANGDTAAK